MNDSTVTCGFYGKAPTHGDFLRRRVPDDFLQPWDEWLQRSIAESRNELAAGWLEVYLTSPIWRFAISRGVCGPSMALGVLMPSVDRVGRYFPMTLVATGLGDTPLPAIAEGTSAWFEELERTALGVVAEDDFRLEQFDAQVEQLAGHPALVEEPGEAAVYPALRYRSAPLVLVAPIPDAGALASAWSALVAEQCRGLGGGCCLWWTSGSERVRPCLLVTEGLPGADAFRAMLDGGWSYGD